MAALQVENADRLFQTMELLFSERDMKAVIKYHNLAHHVHPIGALAGSWEIINSQLFELANREEKAVAVGKTNRKDIEKQILKREQEAMAAERARWKSRSNADYVETVEEKREERRGEAYGFHDTKSVQFPCHELLERETPHHVLLDRHMLWHIMCLMMGVINVLSHTLSLIPVSYTHLTLPTKRIV